MLQSRRRCHNTNASHAIVQKFDLTAHAIKAIEAIKPSANASMLVNSTNATLERIQGQRQLLLLPFPLAFGRGAIRRHADSPR